MKNKIVLFTMLNASVLFWSCNNNNTQNNIINKWWHITCVELPAPVPVSGGTTSTANITNFTKIFLDANSTFKDSLNSEFLYCGSTTVFNPHYGYTIFGTDTLSKIDLWNPPFGVINTSSKNWALSGNNLNLGSFGGNWKVLNATATTMRAQLNNDKIFNFVSP
jgi:hypothetical protein